jgi:hypothetical protein
MKKTYVSLIALLAILALTGCSSENVESDDSGELKITASMDATNSGVSTRSLVTTNAFTSANGSIGIFITGVGYTPASTTFSTTDGSSWTGSSSIYLTGNAATVYGFYPSTQSPSNSQMTATTPVVSVNVPTALSVNAFDASTNSQQDYMYAISGKADATTQATVTKSSATASLLFKHALSELTFIVNKSAEFGGTGNLTNITLTKTSGTFPSENGTMSVVDGALSLSTSTSISLTNSTGVPINDKDGTTVTATTLVAPTTLSDGAASTVTLSMTIDGFTYSKTLPISTVTGWSKGNNYSYTVTVAGGTLSITSVSISEWNPQTADGVTIE